jgi:hypothetical protein
LASAAWKDQDGLELVEEFLSFVQRPAYGHISAVNDEAKIDHEMGNLRIPLAVLEADSASVAARHAEKKERA